MGKVKFDNLYIKLKIEIYFLQDYACKKNENEEVTSF